MTVRDSYWLGCISLLVDVMPSCSDDRRERIEAAVADFCSAMEPKWSYQRINPGVIAIYTPNGERRV